MGWVTEIRALDKGDNNRSLYWCAEQLAFASRQLVFDYLKFLNALKWRRRQRAKGVLR